MLKFQLLILLIGALLIVGLITFDLPDWQLFGVNIALLGAALVFAMKILYWSRRLSLLPTKSLHRWQTRKEARAHEAFDRGFTLFLEQQPKLARNTLRSIADHATYRASANLLIVRCALEEGRLRNARQALEKARKAGAGALVVDLLEAEIYGANGQLEQAQACLEKLRLAHPDHPGVLALCQKYARGATTSPHLNPAMQNVTPSTQALDMDKPVL